MAIINKILVKETVIPRPYDAHKGTFGSLLTVCGSYTMPGACTLCGRAALRSGLGLLNTAVIKSIYPMVVPQMSESIFTPVKENEYMTISKDEIFTLLSAAEKCDAIVVGCGMGNNEDTKKIVEALLLQNNKPLLIDADGINAICTNIDILKEAKCPVVLTPHPGEMSRIIGKKIEFVQKNREQVALDFVEEFSNTVLVLKGAGTLIAEKNKPLLFNHTGNSGMATGGSGDVLSGIIGAFLARNIEPYKAAACGVYIHGLAGDISAVKTTKVSMVSLDIVKNLPAAFREVENV